jgi:hypothetical protein
MTQYLKQSEEDGEGGPMPEISRQEFERLPLRVHDFLAGVPLHDVWAVDLPRTRSGITLDEFARTASALPFTLSPIVRALVNVRLFVGRLLGWDDELPETAWETFATRLTTAGRLSVTLALRPRELDSKLRHNLTTPGGPCSLHN